MSEINGNASSSSTSSSLNSSFQDTEDDQTIAQILAEEENPNSNVKLGKRLSHLDSIPHTPRVIENIPNPDDANFDHDRLSARLATYGLAELQIEGDGNCQFRALADQLFHNSDYHKHVRKEVIKQLKHFRKLYEGYVPMKYRRYLRKMKRSGEWGDHVTLQAAADRFQTKISLVTSFRDTCYIEILPHDRDVRRELWLSFWSEVHYNSLYTAGGCEIYLKFYSFSCLVLLIFTFSLVFFLSRCSNKDTKEKALALLLVCTVLGVVMPIL